MALVVNHRVTHIITSHTTVIASIYQVDLQFTTLPINQIPRPKCPPFFSSLPLKFGKVMLNNIMGKNKMDAYQGNNQLKIEESNRAV